jgi:hypothetical protein
MRASLTCVAITAPLAALMFCSWAFRWYIFMPQERPYVALMAYLFLLMVSGAGLGVALLSGVHLAIHQAFQAGLRTGVAMADPTVPPAARTGTGDAPLELVEGGRSTPHNHKHSAAQNARSGR